MLIQGLWHECDDQFVRPVFCGEVLADDGTWVQTRFLADTGADRTVFSADILSALHLPALESPAQLGGVGGISPSVGIRTQIVFFRENGTRITFRGQFAAFTDVAALDMSVLGRDITDLLAVLIDRPGNLVAMVGPGHRCLIQPMTA